MFPSEQVNNYSLTIGVLHNNVTWTVHLEQSVDSEINQLSATNYHKSED